MYFVGIDVAGRNRYQVIAIMDESFKVDILIEKVENKKDAKKLVYKIKRLCGEDSIIAIDSPRCLSKRGMNRPCERQLRKELKVNLLPTPDKHSYCEKLHSWIKSGMWLFAEFGNHRINVIEVFPSASYKILKNQNFCIKINFGQISKEYRKDIMDAICAAITGYFFKENRYQKFGDEKEGYIIVPKL